MSGLLNKVLHDCGSPIYRQRGGDSAEIRGFFQPVTSKSRQNLERVVSPLGETHEGMYVLIAPAGTDILEGDTLQVGEGHYILRRLETVCYGADYAYCWGLCIEKGQADTWGQ